MADATAISSTSTASILDRPFSLRQTKGKGCCVNIAFVSGADSIVLGETEDCPFQERAVSDLGLTHIALPVRDLDASLQFYSKYAHMQVVHHREHGDGAVAWISDCTRPFVIVLVKAHEVEHPLLPWAHLGVACASRAEVDRLCELARLENCLVSGPKDSGPPVGYWAFLRDPDGHTLEVAYGQDIAFAIAKECPIPQS
jgi:catechol 2,3-dioxygenase-like lactoylglutathione lyase family enzyme